MLAISRALLMRPHLLMLDEPSFGLAPLAVEEIFRILAAINRDDGVSMLIVEQNASLALDLADRAVLIETGRMALSRSVACDPRRRRGASRLSGLLNGEDIERIPAPAGLGAGARRRLCDHGARAGDDLSGNAAREFRPGRDGDVFDLLRLEADGLGLALLARIRGDGCRLLRRRRRDRTPGRPALRQGARARVDHRLHRAGAHLQRPRRLALWLFGHLLRHAVLRQPMVRQRLHVRP